MDSRSAALVLPHADRPDPAERGALNRITPTEAAGSSGAGRLPTVRRVVLANLRRGLVRAFLLTVPVVLDGSTIANAPGQLTSQTALLLPQSLPHVATIFALVALLFVFLLLVVITMAGSSGRSRRARR